MPKSDFIYSDPTIVTSANGDTPYGLYDSDVAFVSESVDVAKYVSRKLGHPVMQLEFNSSSIYACFEESISDYSQYINNYNVKNWLWDHYGTTNRESGSMGTGSVEPMHPRLGMAFALAEQYGEVVGVGGSTDMYSGSVSLVNGQQVYDLQTDANWEHTGSSNVKRLEIHRVFNYGPAAITRFYDPFAGSFDQRMML